MRNAIAILLCLTAALLSEPALAGTVTTTDDSGPGSLRQAIANAAPGETIIFAVSGTITLTSGELLINTDLIISNATANSIAVQRSTGGGTPDFRIFHIIAGTVSISGLTVSNGSADVGGGIDIEFGFLTLQDCNVVGNAATDSGGGIFNGSRATLTISRSVISGNAVAGGLGTGFGGGLDNAGGTVTAISCIISSNSVTAGAGSGAFGGGINNTVHGAGTQGGTLAVTNSVISGNSAIGGGGAEGAGGGINDDHGADLTLDTSTIGSNSATGGAGSTGGPGYGGGIGIGLFGGTATLVRSTVSGNIAAGGVGAAALGGSGQGGGIANDIGTVTVENSTLSGNVANSGAGATGAGPSQGGGIFNGIGSVTLTHSTITANGVSSGDGGGVFNSSGGAVEMENTILAGNPATSDLFHVDPCDMFFCDVLSDGFNLFGSLNAPITPGSNDQFDLTAKALKLGPLQDNGGPTSTHALLCDSPAINAGDNSNAPVTDQRGFPRIVGGTIDIGSFEFNNTPPAISCPAAATFDCAPPDGLNAVVSVNVNDADGDPLVVVWTTNGVPAQTNIVAAGGPVTATSVDFTAAFAVGSYDIAVSVSDPSECVATCSTTVTVQGTPLSIACSAPVSVPCSPPDGAVVTVSADIQDTNSVPLVVVWTLDGSRVQTNTVAAREPSTTAHLDFTNTFNRGVHDIAVFVSDPSGCVASCSTTVTVQDTAPTISCSAPITVECAPPGGAVASVSADVADTDGDPLMVVWTVDGTPAQTNAIAGGGPPTTASVSLTNAFVVGVHAITATVSDPGGCVANCSTTVTVQDTAPTISCSAPVTVQCAPPGGAVVTVSANVSDADGDPLVVVWSVDGTRAQTNTVPAGGSSLNLRAVQLMSNKILGPGSRLASRFETKDGVPAATEVDFTNTFAVGAHEIRVSVSDPTGCVATCSTTVTVQNTAPTISCPAPITLQCAPPGGAFATVSANVNDADGDPLTVVWTVDETPVQTNTIPAGGPPTVAQVTLTNTFPVGSHQIKVSVSDPSGCAAACSTSVTVQDTAPTVICSAPITVKCAPPGGAAATVSANVADAAGDPLIVVWSVDGTPVQTNNIAATGPPTAAQVDFTNTFVAGSHAIIVSASDPSGCLATCSTTVTVQDTVPTISCPAPITLNCAPPSGAVASVSVDVADADGDPLVVVWTVDATPVQTNSVPAGGLISSFRDVQPMSNKLRRPGSRLVSRPEGIKVLSTSAQVGFTNAFGTGVHAITATVSDPSGCAATCSTTVTVQDTAPTISCPAPITLSCAPPGGAVASVMVNVADADGDPLFVVWTVDGSPIQTNTVAASGPPTNARVGFTNLFAVGSHQISISASDPSGCVATCATTVAVRNTAPSISCPAPITVNCAPPGGAVATVSVNVADAAGEPLIVVWAVDGSSVQTNAVAAAGPPTAASVSLTNVFPVGVHVITTSVSDPGGCVVSCATTVTITATGLGNLYPIALSTQTLVGVPIGGVLRDIYNGVQPGNFGWLTWAGSPSEPTLVTSLTPPGNSSTYINPRDPRDHVISVGDWVQGKPGVSNSQGVRKALDTLEQIDITVPVWDRATGNGNQSLYRVAAFARVRLISYRLPNQNRITARFLGLVDCP